MGPSRSREPQTCGRAAARLRHSAMQATASTGRTNTSFTGPTCPGPDRHRLFRLVSQPGWLCQECRSLTAESKGLVRDSVREVLSTTKDSQAARTFHCEAGRGEDHGFSRRAEPWHLSSCERPICGESSSPAVRQRYLDAPAGPPSPSRLSLRYHLQIRMNDVLGLPQSR